MSADWSPVKMSMLDEAKTGPREEQEGTQQKNHSGNEFLSPSGEY